MEEGKHFVLIHGGNNGAWCWYKMVTLLKAVGHRVTALDLAACGVNPKRKEEIASISEFVEPLMEFLASLPEYEKVILVGHSFGGIVISLAMEKFPNKIIAAVYVAAMMPNCISPPASLLLELFKRMPLETMVDNKKPPGHSTGENLRSSGGMMGPNFMAKNVYQKCPPEDLELAKMLVRPNGPFMEDLSKESLLTEGKFGSVNRVYVVCEEDKAATPDFQEWVIKNSPPKEVKFLAGADHMAMLSKPKELFLCFQEIAAQFN